MMTHPYFSSAWQSEMNYVWDSRTVTGVVTLKACRNQQTMSMSAVSGMKTPDGEAALLLRALGNFSKRTLLWNQEFYMAEGDFAGCRFQLFAPHEMRVVMEFRSRRKTFRCQAGWNLVNLEIPSNETLERVPGCIAVSFPDMADSDKIYMGTLKYFLRTDRDVPPPDFPKKVIRADENWKPCDLSDLYVKKGTVLDFSAIVPSVDVDAKGRVTVSNDGHFCYANSPDEYIRFFGHSMALTRSTIPDTHAEIDAFADALRNQGYNLVRIHGVNALLMDGSEAWDGSMPDKVEDIPVVPEIEERLHYFTYALKQRGIYLYLDMCTFINGWHSGDVWMNGGIWINKKHGPTRYSSQFLDRDPAVRANYRAGVLRVMTAMNPYTKMRLADDPCVAFVLGFNELLISNCDEWQKRIKRSKKSLAELNYETLEETAQFIDATIRETGYKGLINQYDNSNKLVNLAVGCRYSSVTNHLYHWCPHKFFYPGSSQGASSTLFSGIGYFRRAARQRPLGKPFGITEYGEPYWNNHRFQQGLGFGAYSAFQDFDMLIEHSTPVMKSGGELRPFSGGNDPASRAAEVITGCAFMRRDITPAKHRICWRYDREFMVKNFDRMIESTNSFAALLTGIGFAYESTPEADLHFQLETAPLGEFFGPEFYDHFKGSEKFNNLVGLLREKKIIASDNATDPGQGIYESETGELKIDIVKEILTLQCPRMEGVSLPAGMSHSLKHIDIAPGNIEAVIALISQDGMLDLDHCRRALLVCGTNALNSESAFLIRENNDNGGKYIVDTENRTYMVQDGEEVLLNNGHAPVLRQIRRGSFEVTLPAMKNPEVYAVKFNGERDFSIPFELKNGRICFTLGDSPSPFFEIVDKSE